MESLVKGLLFSSNFDSGSLAKVDYVGDAGLFTVRSLHLASDSYITPHITIYSLLI